MVTSYRQAEIHYESYGKGKTVVLLHGFLENSSIWEEFVPEIAKNHQVVTIDLLGHGKTGCVGYIHTMEEMAEAVHAVFLDLKISDAAFIGHSMGGYVSLAFLEKYSEKVRSITLLNSTPEPDSEERKENRDRAIDLVKRNPQAFISMALSNLLTSENNKKFAKELQKLKGEALKMPKQGIIAALEGMKVRKNRSKILKFSKKEKYIIAGKEDPVLAYKSAESTAKYCECRFLALNGGHLSFIEDKNALLQFMQFID